MAFRGASTAVLVDAAVTVGSITMPAGTVSTDTVMVVLSIGTGTALPSITWSSTSGNTGTSLVAERADNNMRWLIRTFTGQTAGDQITATLAAATSGGKFLQGFVFTQALGATIGTVGSRGGTSQSTTTAPGIAVTANQPVLVFGIERTTATGTAVSSVVAANGETVTQLSYVEQASDPGTSYYLGRFTPTQNPSGAVTITYSGGSGNGAAVLIQETVQAAPQPIASPQFPAGVTFTSGAVDPNVAVTYKGASAFVSAALAPSLTVPAGTIATDSVYMVVAWGNGTPQVITTTSPAGAGEAVVAPRTDSNLGWTIRRLTGLTAGQAITNSGNGNGPYVGRLFVFDKALAAAGLTGRRSGSTTTVTIPSVQTIVNKPVFVFALERTLADGTTITSTNNANGTSLTQLAYTEVASDPDISLYLGQMTPPGTDSGATTLTYATASGNAAGVAIPAQAPPANAQPAFTAGGKLMFAVEQVKPAGLVRVHLGRPDDNTIRVKTLTNQVNGVRLAVSLQSNMSGASLSSAVVPDAKGYAQVFVGGLQADTQYYWQVQLDGTPAGTINTVRTWPKAGQVAPVVGLLAGACSGSYGITFPAWTDPDTFSYMRAMTDAAGNKARLFVDLGDVIYPCSNNSFNGNIMPANDVVIRNWWEGQLQAPQRQLLNKEVPESHTYSDNDFIGSNSDSTLAPAVAAVSNAVRRQVLADGPFASTDGKGLYWSALLGRVLIIQTDSRSYSSDVMLPNSTPGKSMLGTTQKNWLKGQLARQDCAGIIWFHDNQWVGGAGTSTVRPANDNWGAFATERQEIADHIVASRSRLMLYVHGDNHGMCFDNGSNNAYAGFAWCMVAPLYNSAQAVTLPTSGEAYPTANLNGQKYFTWLEITDNGVTVSVEVAGYNVSNGVQEKLINGVVSSSAGGTFQRNQFFGTISATDIS